jgi:hypothetical protein
MKPIVASGLALSPILLFLLPFWLVQPDSEMGDRIEYGYLFEPNRWIRGSLGAAAKPRLC